MKSPTDQSILLFTFPMGTWAETTNSQAEQQMFHNYVFRQIQLICLVEFIAQWRSFIKRFNE